MKKKRVLLLNKCARATLFLVALIACAPFLFALEHESAAVDKQPKELTEAQFEKMSPEQKADYFRQPQNVVNNLQLAERYFQEPDSFQRARDGAQEFLRRKHSANYVLEPNAGALTYNAAAGTLSSGAKTIWLAEYQNNPDIREIRAVANDIIVTGVLDGATVRTTLSGDGMGEIQYAYGVFTVKDRSGNQHHITPEGSARMSINADGTLTVNGDATGSVKARGTLCGNEPDCFYTFTLKNTRTQPTDPDPQLVITAAGDIAVVDGEAEVDTPAAYLDGLFTTQGKDVLSHAYYHPETAQTKETVLVDKSTGIGVISAGQAKSKNEYVLTHLDHLVAGPSDNPSFSPGPAISRQQAQEQAQNLRRQPAPPQPNSAEVHIKNEGTGTRVSSRGKVKLVSYGLGPDGAVFDRDLYDEGKPVLVGLADGTEMHYLKEGEDGRSREWLDIQGQARFSDNQQSSELTQQGARLQKNAGMQSADKDVLMLSCDGCGDGDAFRISKHVAVITKGDSRYDSQLTQGNIDILYGVENGRLTADASAVSLNTLAALADSGNPSETRIAMDKQLYLQAEGSNELFGIGGNGIGIYQESGETTPVTIVLNSKGVLGEPALFDPSAIVTGIDPAKLSNERYRRTIQQGLQQEERAEALRQQFKRQFGHDVTIEGTCAGTDSRQKACAQALDRAIREGSALGQAYINLRKARVASQKALLQGLAIAAADERKTTAVQELKGIAKAEKSLRSIEQSWAAQRAAAASAAAAAVVATTDAQERLRADAAYKKQLKKDTGTSAYLGSKLNSVEESLRVKREELDKARARLADAATDEMRDALRSVYWLEEDVNTLAQQRAKLEQEFSETAARHAYNAEALATIYMNGGKTEEAKAMAQLVARQPGKSDYGHYLASLACSKAGDAACAFAEINSIRDAALKQRAAQAKHAGIDIKNARREFAKAEAARLDAIQAHTDFHNEREDSPIPSTLRFWGDTDRSKELAAIRVADENAQAAAVVAKLAAEGKTLDAINRMSNEELRAAVGTKDIGDMNGFREGQLQYGAIVSAGGTLTPQQQYDIRMRNANRKVMNARGDEIVGQEDYLSAIREFGGKGVDVSGAYAALERIEEDKKIRVTNPAVLYVLAARIAREQNIPIRSIPGISLLFAAEELTGTRISGMGVSTEVKTQFSSQQIGRFSSDMIDVTAFADVAFLFVKAGVGLLKLGKAKLVATGIHAGAAIADVGEDVAQAAARAVRGSEYYRILGIAEDATTEQIKTAYHGLARVHHPDVGGNAEEFMKISDAYQTLSDAGRRAAYNQRVTQEAVQAQRAAVAAAEQAARAATATDALSAAQQAQRTPSRLGIFLSKERHATETGRFISGLEELARAEQAAGNLQEAAALAKHAEDARLFIQAERIHRSQRGGAAWTARSSLEHANLDDIPKNLRSPVARAMSGASDTIRSAHARVAQPRAKLWRASRAYEEAKLLGDAQKISAAARKLVEAEKRIHLEYYLDGFFRVQEEQILAKAREAARAAQQGGAAATEATLQLERAAQKMIADTRVFAANVDREAASGRALIHCVNPCTMTEAGKRALEQADTLPDIVAEQATALHAVPDTAVDNGLDVMRDARAADAGTDATRVVTPNAIDDLIGRAETNPRLSGAARQQALDDVTLRSALPNEIAREEGKAMQMLPEIRARAARETKQADAHARAANTEQLFTARPDQRGRLTLWVEQDTGEIMAVGRFDEAGEVARSPSVQQIIVAQHPVAGYQMPEIGEALSPRAKRVLAESLDEHARLPEPDVFASAPPPRSLERLPAVERAERVERVVPPQPVVASRAGTVPVSLPPPSPVSAFDYDSLQVMNILDISPTAARSRGTDAVRRIGAAYKEEVGFLDAGKPTPRLEQLIREGALTPNELDRLRRGAPLAMGGRTQEDLVLSSLRADLSRLSSDGKIDEMVDSLFAGRDTLKSDKSDKFKSLEAQVMGAVLGEPEKHAAALERIVSREVDKLKKLPIRIERGLSDAEAKVLYEKSPTLAERVGVRRLQNPDGTYKYDGWGYEHALKHVEKYFDNSQNKFDGWIKVISSSGGLELQSGRDAKKVLKYMYDPLEENLVFMLTQDGKLWTMLKHEPSDFLSELNQMVDAGFLNAFKPSDDIRYIVKDLPDGRKHIVQLSRVEGNKIKIDARLVDSFDTSKMEGSNFNNLERFGKKKDKFFGDVSLLEMTCP